MFYLHLKTRVKNKVQKKGTKGQYSNFKLISI